MNVVIVGCGRTGSTLAVLLSREGHNVWVIDTNQEAFRRLGKVLPQNIRRVLGNGLDEDTLREAHTDSADAFVACTQGDNTNIMAMQVVRERFKVPKIGAKINDPIRGEEYRKLGFFVISECLILGGVFADWLQGKELREIAYYMNSTPYQ